MPGYVISILGAESTGKSTLALALCAALACPDESGRAPRCTVVSETLREFCDHHGRTPHVHEQAGIAAEQTRRIDVAAATHDLVIADTTALMTAVYSELVFGDTGLYAQALADQRRWGLTLLTALDLPWQADGLQRDGAHVRAPVDALVRRALLRAGLGWSVVAGQGPARLQQALDAVRRAWAHGSSASVTGATQTLVAKATTAADAGAGADTDDSDGRAHGGWRHVCTNCGDGDCERRLFTLNRAGHVA
jgi:nicotinamide riboside kinase